MSLWMEGGAVCENPYAKEQGYVVKKLKGWGAVQKEL